MLSSFKAYRKVNDPYLFSLRKDGYCISFDIPYDKKLNMDNLVRELNAVTIKYSGQVYLAKTPCVNAEEFSAMYSNINEFKEIKKELDPQNVIQSNLSRRLELS